MTEINSISDGLELGKDGIWHSFEKETISYPEDGSDNCFDVEDDSFWFRHRNDCIVSAVKSFPPPGNGAIFDIGGGNGFVSLGLSKAGFGTVLVEPGKGAYKAKQRGLEHVICATSNTAKFKPNTLPAVGLFDVIEHIEDDVLFLKSIRMLLKSKGRLYVTVPSYPLLWSEDDVSAGHFRRYTLDKMTQLLIGAGYKIDYASYIFRFLPIPIFFLKALPHKLSMSKSNATQNSVRRNHAAKPGAMGGALSLILRREVMRVEDLYSMRFGSSCLIVARN